jgi:hypothetical protein
MSVRFLSRIELAVLPHLFQPLARDRLNAGNFTLIVSVDQLQAQAPDTLIVGALAEHFMGEHLLTPP